MNKTRKKLLVLTFIIFIGIPLIYSNPMTKNIHFPQSSALGDVNDDGRIDIVDGLMVAQYYVGLNPAGFNSGAADVDSNGNIDIIDALLIAQHYAGLLSMLGAFSGTYASTAGGPNEVWFEPLTIEELGETFTMEIYVDTGSQNCAAYGFVLEYDPSVLQIQSIDAGSEGFLMADNINNTAGNATVNGFDISGKGPDSQLELVTITWESVGLGLTSIYNTIDRLVDSSYASIGTPFTPTHSFHIVEINLGDVDMDGDIDIIDALLTTQYYVGLITEINTDAADVNDDGLVTIVDALLIVQSYVGLDNVYLDPHSGIYTSTAGGPDEVWFESITPHNIGDVFTTDIYVNTGVDECAAYGFKLDYDSTIVEVQSVAAGSEGFLMASNIDNLVGITVLAGFDAAGAGPDNQLELVTVTWETVGGGSTVVNNTIDRLTDEYGMAIGIPYTDELLLLVRMLGDVNEDYTINSTDGLFIAQKCVGIDPLGFQSFFADVNEDGQINCNDSLHVYQYLSGIIPEVNSTLPSSGGSSGELWIEPITDKLMGDSCTTTLYLNTSTQGCAAFKLDVLYDPSILTLITVAPGSDGNLTAYNITNSDGKTQIIGIDPYGSCNGNELELLEISWDILAWGESEINISVQCLLDDTTTQIVPSSIINGTVSILEPESPIITINSPAESAVSNSPPTITFEITSLYSLDDVWYCVNGGENFTIPSQSSLTIDTGVWNGLSEGAFLVSIYANCSTGHFGLTIRYFVKDTIDPTITIGYPGQNYEYSSKSPPVIELYVSDPHLDTLMYTINDGPPVILTEITSGDIEIAILLSTWEAIPDGDVTFIFTVNDTAGNEVIASLNIIKYTQKIPGFNIPILIGCLFLFGLVFTIKRRKLG